MLSKILAEARSILGISHASKEATDAILSGNRERIADAIAGIMDAYETAITALPDACEVKIKMLMDELEGDREMKGTVPADIREAIDALKARYKAGTIDQDEYFRLYDEQLDRMKMGVN